MREGTVKPSDPATPQTEYYGKEEMGISTTKVEDVHIY